MSLYVYCVTDEAVSPASIPTGVQDQATRIVSAEGLHVVVSEFSGSELKPTKENVFAHERVLDLFMDQGTPLPFRFATVVAEATLLEFLAKNVAILRTDLEKVRGCVEMGLKVMTEGSVPQAVKDRGYNSGTEFLQAKRRQQELPKETGAWVEAAVRNLIRSSEVSLMASSPKTIIRIAHLVPRGSLREYKSNIDALVRNRTECAFLTSGPWPPYSFISTSRLG